MSTLNALDQAAVLFIGATGYIGGSVLVAFTNKHPEFLYTAIVRNPKDNKAVESLNVRVVQGSNADLELVEKVTSEHDVVVNCADADDLPLADAVIKGLLARAARKDGARKPIYIHTRSALGCKEICLTPRDWLILKHPLMISGTGVVTDRSPGIFADIKIYDVCLCTSV